MAEKRKRGRPRKPESERKVYKPTGRKRGRPRKTSSEEALLTSPIKKRKATKRKKKAIGTIVKINCGTNGYMDYLVGRKVKLKVRPNWVGDEYYYGIIMSPGYEGTPMMFSKDELVLDNPEDYKDDNE